MSFFCCNFAGVMDKRTFYIYALCVFVLGGCNRPSKVEDHRHAKHIRDSIGLVEQQRSLHYYQSQLDSLMPVADSLLTYFSYEKDGRYQDHGYYVVKPSAFSHQLSGKRILVRDDGYDLLVYSKGKRIEPSEAVHTPSDAECVECARKLQVTIKDIKELEKRIFKTSLEVQKYEKRLQK